MPTLSDLGSSVFSKKPCAIVHIPYSPEDKQPADQTFYDTPLFHFHRRDCLAGTKIIERRTELNRIKERGIVPAVSKYEGSAR